MTDGHFIGIDIGTSSTKAVLMDRAGQVVCDGSIPTGTLSPAPGLAEQDPERCWWASVVRVIDCLRSQMGSAWRRRHISGLGVCGLFPAVVPLSSSGRPLRPAILYGIDRRCVDEAAQLEQAFGDPEILRVSGNVMSPQSIAPKLLWLRRHEPDVFGHTSVFTDAAGYIVRRFTGCDAVDPVRASSALAYDMARGEWNSAFCEYVGLGPGQLPSIRPSHEVIGVVTEAAALETGIAPGTPVVTGTGDIAAELVSAGLGRGGEALLACGSTFCVIRPVDDYLPSRPIGLAAGLLDIRHIMVGGSTSGGNTRDWAIGLFSGDITSEAMAGETLDAEAARIRPGSDGLVFLPYLRGERAPVRDPGARGVLFGLTDAHTRAHVYRGMLEGVGYAVRDIIEAMEQLSGSSIGRVAAVGGGASTAWVQIISDIIGLPMTRLTGSSAARGAAILAAVGAGVADPRSLPPPLELQTCSPNLSNTGIYAKGHKVYRRIYQLLRGMSAENALLTELR